MSLKEWDVVISNEEAGRDKYDESDIGKKSWWDMECKEKKARVRRELRR